MKPHVLCVPSPAPSHVGAMLKLAKILHLKGFFVTFVNTDFNQARMLRTGALASLDGVPDWRFVSMPDGLPPSDGDSEATADLDAMCDSVMVFMVRPFSNLVDDLISRDGSRGVPPITCILADGFMNFATGPTAERVGLPLVHLYTINACSLMAFKYCRDFLERGLASSIDGSWSERLIDWIPGMKTMRERDMPSFAWTAGSEDTLLRFVLASMERLEKADATIIHTFEDLESVVLHELSSMICNVYAIGPFQLLLEGTPQDEFISKQVHVNLWEEHAECLEWLDTKDPGSVLYVNFGSVAFLTLEHLTELAAGLSNSKCSFLWVLRPDIVKGEEAPVLPPEFVDETKRRGFLSGWCPQEKVLNHSSVGGFLTHCGWNSILESLTAGVPMICWPKLGDQMPNARYVCEEWKAGLEFGDDVNRHAAERLVRELMGGEKGKELKRNAMEWKRLAAEAASPAGSSAANLEKLVKDVMLARA